MGTVYKKTFTKPLPAGAEIFTRKSERLARWKPAKGRTRTAPLTVGKDGSDRIVVTVGTYTAKYRDGSGVVQEKATGCRDKEAAGRVLADLERRAELVKAKVISASEDAIADHQDMPLAEHFEAYIDHQKARELNRVRIQNTRNRLSRLAEDCDFRRLGDLSAVALERWLVTRQAEGMGAGNRNEYRQELVGFGNWCVRTGRLITNPFAKVPKADTKADCRRKRRALTENELTRLLEAAKLRPLLDAMTVRRGKDKGRPVAKLRPETQCRLEALGRERALIYKTMVLTGLRKAELASLAVGSLELDQAVPYAVLNAADEKNRQGSEIPLRDDLARDLKQWLAEKLSLTQAEAQRQQKPSPSKLPPDTPLFNVPSGLVRILDRDLAAAGIPKRDDRGRTVDVHALRHTFGTHLSKGGVAPRTAQAAMRHSQIDLTMNVYTDPRLLDVVGALDALPLLPLDGEVETNQATLSATGTESKRPPKIAPMLAPNPDKPCKSLSSVVKMTACKIKRKGNPRIDASPYSVKRKTPLTNHVNGVHQVERRRVELPTSALRTQRSPN